MNTNCVLWEIWHLAIIFQFERKSVSAWVHLLQKEIRELLPKAQANSRGVRGHAPPGNFFKSRCKSVQSGAILTIKDAKKLHRFLRGNFIFLSYLEYNISKMYYA